MAHDCSGEAFIGGAEKDLGYFVRSMLKSCMPEERAGRPEIQERGAFIKGMLQAIRMEMGPPPKK